MKSSYCPEVIITFGNCPGVNHRGINEHYPHLLGCTERDIYRVDDLVQGCTWNQVFCPKFWVIVQGQITEKLCPGV